MTTPYKLLTHKYDPWHVRLKKRVARWLWNDLTKLPKPAKGYPDPERISGHIGPPSDWFTEYVKQRQKE